MSEEGNALIGQLDDGVFRYLLSFLDVAALSNLNASSQTLRTRCAIEWDHRHELLPVLGRSKASTIATAASSSSSSSSTTTTTASSSSTVVSVADAAAVAASRRRGVIQFYRGETFAQQDEEVAMSLTNERDTPRNERTEKCISPEEVDQYEFFLRVSKEQPLPTDEEQQQQQQPVPPLPVFNCATKKDVIWQGFVPAWSQKEFARQFLSQYNPNAYHGEEDYECHGVNHDEHAIHLDLRSITEECIRWDPTISDLLTGTARLPARPNTTLTVVAVPLPHPSVVSSSSSSSSSASVVMAHTGTAGTRTRSNSTSSIDVDAATASTTSTMVLSLTSVGYYPFSDAAGDSDYPIFGVMLSSQYLPQRLVDVELYTNIPVNEVRDPAQQAQAQYHVMTIHSKYMSEESAEFFLSGGMDIGELDWDDLQNQNLLPNEAGWDI